MAFRDNSFATVWEIKPTKGSSMSGRISTSYKDKRTGEYVNDFGEYVLFSGEAAKKAANLKEKDRIKLLQTSVTSQWDKEKKVNRYSFFVWDFEPANGAQQSAPAPKAPVQDDDDGGLPF